MSILNLILSSIFYLLYSNFYPTMHLSSTIEGILFFRGEPATIKELAKMCKKTEGEIRDALKELEQNLAGRGVQLVTAEDTVTLATAKELSSLLEDLRKEELNKELSKATLETLSIVLYKNGATRSEIDYIRGVNSSFILRNLEMRGLVGKREDPNDARRYIYAPTIETLSYLGVAKIEELPEYEKIKETLSGASAHTKSDEQTLAAD